MSGVVGGGCGVCEILFGGCSFLTSVEKTEYLGRRE